jgi:DNA-binding GntR family transcriptional regulator
MHQLVEVLRERILSGELPAASWIRQDELARSLGLSKIPIREALCQLERDGLVESQKRRGFFVRPLARDEACEIFDLRLRIEPELLGQAAMRLTTDARQAAQDALVALEQGIATGAPHIGKLNREFHLSLARPGAGPIAMDMLDRLLCLSERYVAAHLEPKGRNRRASRDHEEMFLSWSNNQPERLKQLARQHIERTASDLAAQLL